MTLVNALGWTLLYFLWQGTAIAIFLAAALAITRRASARTRCAVSGVALLVMFVAAAATFVKLVLDGSTAPVAVSAINAASPDFLPTLVWCWFGGVILFGLRATRAWVVARRFARRNTSAAPHVWQAKMNELTARLAISKPIRLAVSTLAEVPAVIGWLRPVVLLPASVLTGLSFEQVESLLAHELAHISRNDYLVNLLQTFSETLFFYHPAVWWVNRQIREERENCCDDLAAEICGSRIVYARALIDLEQLRGTVPQLAVAAGGGTLLRRIERLLKPNERPAALPVGWTVGVATALLSAVMAVNAVAQNPPPPPAPPAPPAPAAPPALPAPPAPPALATPPTADAIRRQIDIQRRKADIQLQQADIEKQNAEMLNMREEMRQSVAAMKDRRATEEMQQLRNAVEDIRAAMERTRNVPTSDVDKQLQKMNSQLERLGQLLDQLNQSLKPQNSR